MDNFKNMLEEYARLTVEVGANAQPGEPVLISCPIEGADFARALARHAYRRGATEVHVNWADDELALMKYENAPMEVFESFPPWMVDRSKYYYEKGASIISVYATDPQLLQHVDPKKIAAASKSQSVATKEIRKYTMNDILSWCVVSIPTKAWAKKVFPELEPEAAYEKLWEAIFKVTRMDQADPVGAWQDHLAKLNSKALFLNEAKFVSLHYRSSNGTDLKVELPKGHIWMSAGSNNAKGIPFVPNMPTEEVFTLPAKEGVNGELYSTRPLNYAGNIIDGMRFTFEKGRVVDYEARVGEEYLKDMFAVDDNGRYLGEVALVPHSSPISQSGILFYNTLFDENASCHFAFGAAYPTTLEGGTSLSPEELAARGANDALIHEDFMVGSEDLEIIGTTEDGKQISIFTKGNWAI